MTVDTQLRICQALAETAWELYGFIMTCGVSV